ncbi:hypothetical protein T069G_10011 [Trichoderma breve]|uniref:Uncharacterized protein n=1 Tax=Trichoderma breve TaxID=2034170 RepID=A0A9W9B592_9HYPO|nr:hypothetical protein T069G_10011 [Trichoderma breve]KAJ4856643.1 hypothetical protein T069G_10011 [Trichoderma breve]
MTDERDNSDSDWEHLQTMCKDTPPTEKGDTVQNEIGESGNNSDEKKKGEPPQEKNAKVEENKTPSEDHVKADKDSTPQDKPIEKKDKCPHNSSVKGKDDKSSHDHHNKKEESKPPQDDLVKAKQLANPPENHPIPGKSCIIATRTKPPRFYVLKNGQPEFLAKPILSGGHIWNTEEKDGWLSFRNETSGTCLGQNKEGKVEATQKQPKQQERFTARRKENGGYVLFVLQETALLGVAISEDGQSLVLQKGEGEALDFIDSKYLDGPMSLKYPNMPAQKLR